MRAYRFIQEIYPANILPFIVHYAGYKPWSKECLENKVNYDPSFGAYKFYHNFALDFIEKNK